MSRRPEYSQICRLMDDSLRPYIESQVVSVTKEKEKDLLIALSQVSREIRRLKHALDFSSESSTVVKRPDKIGCSGGSGPHSGNHRCLATIIADLIPFLSVESQFVRHSTRNVLVVISELVAGSESSWKCFIHLLCVCLELAISHTLSYSLAPSITVDENSSYGDTLSFVDRIHPRLKNANWFTVSSIIQVLRDVLKYLKQKCDNQLLAAYLDSVSSGLSNVPWELLNKIHADEDHDAQKSSCNDALRLRNVWQPELRIAFLGNLVQFFCTLVGLSDLVEGAVRFPAKLQMVHDISNHVPALLQLCLVNQEDHNNISIFKYFRHKLLVLMIRLSFQISMKYPILVSWLQLLHMYFQDLLMQPLTELESAHDDCLEGSPFLSSLSDGEVSEVSTRHSKRQAVFLFLKCCFSLISLRDETEEQCACTTLNSLSTFDQSSDLDCCSRKKSLSELYKWLQKHLPSNMFVDHKSYVENCINFAQSFLRLYMHEDDMLFEVLLQLFSIPFCTEQLFYKDTANWKEMKENICYHVSNIFNPVCLFHLFLAELHYDHRVLLDYLISKDTGINCAQYLLRCLRTVCNSWHLFVEFAMVERVLNQSSCKKRKVILDGPNSPLEISYASERGDVVELGELCRRECKHGSKFYTSRGWPFKKAKECLLSLQNSVENLHQKNLFPYNPEVLLKRLRRFQELCFGEQRLYSLENKGTTEEVGSLCPD